MFVTRQKWKETNVLIVKKIHQCEVFLYDVLVESGCSRLMSGLLMLHDGAISDNQPQIASDRTIHKRTHNIHKIKHKSTRFLGIPA